VKVEGENSGDVESVGFLLLRGRRHLEKLPKRGCDTEKDNDSGCCPVSGVLLLGIYFNFFFSNMKLLKEISKNDFKE
jgi:hypothetical protein